MDEHRQSGPVTREKLIEAAGEVFAEHGLHGARIRDITRRAGANIAAVNYHFHDKTELYAVVLHKAHEGVLGAMNQPLQADSPEGRIRELLTAMLSAALDPQRPEWQRRLLGRELLHPTPALDRLRDVFRAPTQRLQEAVEQIRPDLAAPQTMYSVCAMIAQCIFYVHHRHVMHRLFPELGNPDAQTLIDALVEYSLSAIQNLPPEER